MSYVLFNNVDTINLVPVRPYFNVTNKVPIKNMPSQSKIEYQFTVRFQLYVLYIHHF